MLTAEQIIEYAQRQIAQDRLSGNIAGLRQTQNALGFLMSAGRQQARRRDGR